MRPRTILWASLALVAYTHAGYGLVLAALERARRPRPPRSLGFTPDVSLIVAAYEEEAVIGDKVRNALELDWPRERLEVVVCSDGSRDGTVEAARAAGADLVLDLPRGGKVRAQDAGVRRARGGFLAFSDANSRWEPDALRRLLEPFGEDDVGYVCGQVRFVNEEGTNQEGLYWRWEMWVRERESRLASVTAGNGAIYATRRAAYIEVDPIMGHDLSFPFNMVKRGWRAVYAPAARATEKMVPSVEGEFARKRRMMSHTWPIVVRGGLLSPRGYPPLYALMVLSHRALRYATPFLHAAAVAAGLAAVARRPARRIDGAALGAQLGLLAAAALARRVPARPLLVARYYVLTTASIAAGLLDWLREGTEAGWEPPEGTR